MPAVHVAILKPHFVPLILAGRKTVESRLYRTPMPPIGCAHVGERVYLKESAGPFRAVARIAAVKEYHDLTPTKIDELAARYNRWVCGDEAYWRSKRDSRFASFIRLVDVQPIDAGPRYTKSMRAWHVVDEREDVIVDLPVKQGGLKHHHLYVPVAACGFAEPSEGREGSRSRKRLKLLLPDGLTVETDITTHRYVRWRGWGRYYKAHGMRPGDTVRLIALGHDRYRVQFLHHAAAR